MFPTRCPLRTVDEEHLDVREMKMMEKGMRWKRKQAVMAHSTVLRCVCVLSGDIKNKLFCVFICIINGYMVTINYLVLRNNVLGATHKIKNKPQSY